MSETFRREALAIIQADTRTATCMSPAEVYAAARISLASVCRVPQRVEIAANGRKRGSVRVRICGPELIGEFTVGLKLGLAA
ncbi:hypothetical protein GGR33_004670 [Methylobacterium brachythecii]|uniref:Uncharacterized protein n=1 Tax=Methylobacterium brachythecii TaxID=1176177 RepID=A0A7W6AKJ4_9HYPH|nr:hypothetical protein [Methylobacterium brachythecii]MBB3905142.1 hypothetical protein [Methylobacterium brachythecii]GLS44351.1 hypothetical protein GCM10007884_23390 [Methylobacterium brachythecii]